MPGNTTSAAETAVPNAAPAPATPTANNTTTNDNNGNAVTADPDESNPWARENTQITGDDFVLVTRPLDSIRLADVWLQREQLPNAHNAHMRVTAIRRDIWAVEGSNNGAEDTNVRRRSGSPPAAAAQNQKNKNDAAGGKKSKKDSSVAASSAEASTTSDECTMLVDQQSFMRDMLRAFTAKPTVSAATSVAGTFASASSSQTDPIGDANTNISSAMSSYADNSLTTNNNNTSSASSSPTMINDQQWKKIWQQFRADIGRELFCIEGRRFMDADEAYVALTDLFKQFEGEWLAYQSALLAAEGRQAPALTRSVSAVVWAVAKWPAVTAVSLTMNIVTAPFKLLRLAYNGGRTATSTTTTTTAATSTAPPHSSEEDAAGQQQQSQPPPPNDPLLCEGLARFVVLLSQQSVLAFPYELLHHQFTTGAENVYVGEIRTMQCGGGSDEDEEEYAENTREEREMASSMKVDIRRVASKVTTTTIAASPTINRTHPPAAAVPKPPPAPSADGVACSTSPASGPIPDDRNIAPEAFDGLPPSSSTGTAAEGSASSSSAAAAAAANMTPTTTKTSISAPFVVLTVSKEFRVFALEDCSDHTLFHIVANISLDVTNATDPVTVSWSLKPCPSRKDRARPSRLCGKGLLAEQRAANAANAGKPPAYALNAATPTSNPMTTTSNNTPIANASGNSAPANASSSSSAAATPLSPPQPQQQQSVRDPSAPQRLCDCLGGTMGYHRRDCAYGGGSGGGSPAAASSSTASPLV